MKDLLGQDVTDWEPPQDPKELMEAWNLRFPVGTEVAVDLGSFSFIDKTTSAAYLNEGQAVVTVANVQGDPKLLDLCPLIPGTLSMIDFFPDSKVESVLQLETLG